MDPQRTTLFVSYSRKDREWLELIETTLKPLLRDREFVLWDDSKINAGDIWRQEIDTQLKTAQAALFLVSRDFLASDFIQDQELPILLKRANEEGLKILWVYVRDCLVEESPLSKYQAVSAPDIPLARIDDKELDLAITQICRGIRAVIGSLPSAKVQPLLPTKDPEQDYIDALQGYCANLEVEGWQNLPGLALKEVFVPLRITNGRDRLRGFREIWDFLPKWEQLSDYRRRIAIIAAPGHGKTTLLRHLAYTYACDHRSIMKPLLPVLLRLREIHHFIRESDQRDLSRLIAEYLAQQPKFESVKVSAAWFEERLQQGNCLVLLDGLDEVPKERHDQVRRWAYWQMQAYGQVQFILTSRRWAFKIPQKDPVHPIETDIQLEILDFNPDQKQTFIEQWYQDYCWRHNWFPLVPPLSMEQAQIQSRAEAKERATDLSHQVFTNQSLNELARNPLLITMITLTHQVQTQLSYRRVELYRDICQLLLSTRPHVRKIPLSLAPDQNIELLEILALNLMKDGSTQFTIKDGSKWLKKKLDRFNPSKTVSPNKVIEEMKNIVGLLVEKTPDLYEFSHKTFQEYLAAKRLRGLGTRGGKQLYDQLGNTNWREVVSFYVALGDATGVIKKLLENPTQEALKLAWKCQEQAQGLDPKIRQQLEEALARNSDSWTSEIHLEQRIRNLTSIGRGTALDPNFITWGEYQLFLEDQSTGQFHSTAQVVEIPQDPTQPVTGIPWQDALWFCAWLGSKANLQPEKGVYDYRLPTAKQLQKHPHGSSPDLIPYTEDPETPGNCIRILRVAFPGRYGSLLNYLANGRWREADEETHTVMLEVAKQTRRQYLLPEDIEKFPCEDLRILDHLWVKYSGGHFGFSVQKKIYVNSGNPLDGQYHEKTWEKFADEVGWRVNGKYISYSRVTFNTSSPVCGHLPRRCWGWWGATLLSWASRLAKCNPQGI